MKTLVVYYSKTGNTEQVADEIAKLLNADTERIVEPDAKRDGILGFLRSGRDGMLKRPSTIAAPIKQASDYDCVIVGSPVWGWNLVPAIRAYLSSSDLSRRRVALFCTMGSSGEDKTFQSMRELVGDAEVLGELAVRQDELKDTAALRARLARWLEPIAASAD